jgi:hypothetical protein
MNSSKIKGKTSKRLAAKSQEKLNTSTVDDNAVAESSIKANPSLPEPLLKISNVHHHNEESKSTQKEKSSADTNETKSKTSSIPVSPESTTNKQNVIAPDSGNKGTKSIPPQPAIKSPLIIHSTLMTGSSTSFNDSNPVESPQPQVKSKMTSQLRSIRKLRVAKSDTNNTSTTNTSTVVQSDNSINTKDTEPVNVRNESETSLVTKDNCLSKPMKDNATRTNNKDSLPTSIAEDNVKTDIAVTAVSKETTSNALLKETVSITNTNVDKLENKVENSEKNNKSVSKTKPVSKEDKIIESKNARYDSSKETMEKTTPISKRRGLRGKKESADQEVEIKSPEQQDKVSTEKTQNKAEVNDVKNMETPRKETVTRLVIIL